MSSNHQASELWQQLQETHRADLEAVTQVLAKITSRQPEQITPYLTVMLEQLVEISAPPFYETATPEEWSLAWHEWVESHRSLNLPSLSDEAVSRASIYEENG
jgi:hypothetical protein